MGRLLKYLTTTGLAVLLVACQTTSSLSSKRSSPTLAKTLAERDVISVPYRIYGKSVFILDLKSHEGKTLPFMVDTGATRSALFKSTVKKLDLVAEEDTTINIHGMMQNGRRPVVKVPALALDDLILSDLKMAVLDDREGVAESLINPAGLIGMDVLSDYRVFVDADLQTFNLIPKSLARPQIPTHWENVQLYKNPFKEVPDNHDLHFMEIRLGNKLLPALLDTGSEFSLMNWSVAVYPQLKRARRKLYETWLIEGALGTFDPMYKIKAQDFRSGQKYWDSKEFIVMNFDGLDILGVSEQPFLIAGSNLFSDQTFYMDFEDNIIRFKNDRDPTDTLGPTMKVYRSGKIISQ